MMQAATWTVLIVYVAFLRSTDAAISWSAPQESDDPDTTFTIKIAESAAVDDEVATFTAADGDADITYEVTEADDAFTLDDNVLKLASSLDYSKTESYELKIKATSDADPVTMGIATVTINVNGAPDFGTTDLEACVLDKSEAGTVAATLNAPDPENEGTVIYKITNRDSAPNSDLNVDGDEVQVSDGITLDKSTTGEYKLTITAEDNNDEAKATSTVELTVKVQSECNAAMMATFSIFTVLMALLSSIN